MDFCFFVLFQTDKYSIPDLLCTYSEHIAREVSKACHAAQALPQPYFVRGSPSSNKPARLVVLVTGGGAFNKCVMDRLREKLTEKNIALAETDDETVQFKEALLFAFLGLRCLLGQHNVSSSVTGSSMDSVSGSIHLPPKSAPTPLTPKRDKLPFGFNRQSSHD